LTGHRGEEDRRAEAILLVCSRKTPMPTRKLGVFVGMVAFLKLPQSRKACAG